MEVCGVPGYLLYSTAALAIGSRTMLLADHNASRTQWLAIVPPGWRILTAFSFHTNLNDQEQKINSMKSMALLLGFWFLPREGGKERRAGLGHVGESSDHGRTGEKEKCRPRCGYIIGSAGGLVPEAFQSRQRSAPMFDRR